MPRLSLILEDCRAGMCLGMPAATKSDSIEVLGYRNEGEWLGCQINSLHEARNPSEVHRIYAAHPNEDPIQDNRVLGFLEPTRGELIYRTLFQIRSVYLNKFVVQLLAIPGSNYPDYMLLTYIQISNSRGYHQRG